MASKTLPILTSTLLIIYQFLLSIQQTTIVKGGYWIQDTEFPVSNVNSKLFTHLFYGYADVNNKTYQVTIPSSKQLQFSTFTETLQFQNPSVKTLLSINGTDALNPILASMVSQNSTRKSFIDSSINLARSNNFHGLDLDWQYPSNSSQMTNLGYLLTEWRAAIVTEAQSSGKSPLLLSSTVLVLSYYYDASILYPIPAISNSLDWINVIAYDYYGPTFDWSPNQTGPSAALYNPDDEENSGDYGVKSWIQAGLSSKKIVLGFPFYGWSWRLVNTSNNGLFAPANGSSLDFVGDGDGSGGYNQIRDYISQKNATKDFNETIVSDYCYSGSTWIGYDDVQSISTKVLYAKENGLLGYFAWDVGRDDNWILSTTAFQTFPEESQSNSKTGDSMTIAAKLAIGIGTSLFAVTTTLIICGLIYRSKWIPVIFTADFRRRNRDFEAFLRNNGPLSVKRYSFLEVKKMTNFFKDKLGQGGYGSVYKGKQHDGHFVAIKVLNASKGEEGEEFINEVVSISRTSHVNIVSLLGFCLEGQKQALVYEFMPNGSLDKFLKIGSHLEWERLHQIAIGIARGLEYLHRGCNTRIVHFDIKPHNILLDENFCPKISDFGLAKLYTKKESILSMIEARGTIGYIAPEVFSRNFGGISYKSDVYSYGMMVLEMVGRREKDEVVTNDTSSSENYFPNSFYKRLEMGNESEFYGEISIDEVEIVRKMTMVGLWCIQTNPSDRPSMSRVIEMLEGSSETLNIPPKPFHNSSVPKSPSLCSISTSIE